MLAKRAQSINEYAMVIAVVTLAAVTMQTYVKRGIQGVIKLSADVLIAGGTQPAAPAAAGPRQQALLNLPDGAYNGNGIHNGINYSQYQYWHPAFINGYIHNLGGYVETKPDANGQSYTTINPGPGMTGFISMVKEGNDVYYYHYPQQGSSNKLTIAAEDATTGILTTFSPYDGQADTTYKANGTLFETYTHVGPTGARIRDKTFSPYKIVRPSNDAIAQQKGIEETGLYSFKMADGNPLKVTSNKTLTVKESPLNAVTIPRNYWPSYVLAYQSQNGGSISIKIEGNTVKYYHFSSDPHQKELIGIEDVPTADFTIFDADGFVNVVYNEYGERYTDLEPTYHYDPVETTKVISVTVKRKMGETYVTVGTYGKYQPARISQVAVAHPYPHSDVTTRTTANNETTTVSGGWEATYKLGTDIYKPKPKPGDKP